MIDWELVNYDAVFAVVAAIYVAGWLIVGAIVAHGLQGSDDSWMDRISTGWIAFLMGLLWPLWMIFLIVGAPFAILGWLLRRLDP